MNATKDLTQFLSFTLDQKEAALLIAKTEKDINKSQTSLIALGYLKSENPTELAECIKEARKTFIFLKEENAKDLYDIIIQYPTGQISYFDNEEKKMTWIRPQRGVESAVIVVTSVDTLREVEKKGLPYRAITGLAYQN